jgi:hypothetical protein
MAILRESFEDSSLPSHASYPWFSVEASASDNGIPVIVVHGEVDGVSAPELTDVVGNVLKGIPNADLRPQQCKASGPSRCPGNRLFSTGVG